MSRKNNTVQFMKMKKTLYGCLKSVFIFYQQLSSYLKNKGFSVNPYDPCMEKNVKWGKMTVTWHVDDLNISNVKSREVTRIIEWIEYQYVKMRISRGKVHDIPCTVLLSVANVASSF